MNIRNRTTFASSDISVKDGKFSRYWIIIDKQKKLRLNNESYHEEWRYNTPHVAEAITLLELLEVIGQKGRYIDSRQITICFDNQHMCKRIIVDIRKSNYMAQEAGAKIATIKQLLKKIKFNILLKLTCRHPLTNAPFDANLTPYLIILCDREAKRIRD